MVLEPRFCEYTTCTAGAPEAVRTVRMYGLMKFNLTGYPAPHPISAHFPLVVTMKPLVHVSICNMSQQNGLSREREVAETKQLREDNKQLQSTSSQQHCYIVWLTDLVRRGEIDAADRGHKFPPPEFLTFTEWIERNCRSE